MEELARRLICTRHQDHKEIKPKKLVKGCHIVVTRSGNKKYYIAAATAASTIQLHQSLLATAAAKQVRMRE